MDSASVGAKITVDHLVVAGHIRALPEYEKPPEIFYFYEYGYLTRL